MSVTKRRVHRAMLVLLSVGLVLIATPNFVLSLRAVETSPEMRETGNQDAHYIPTKEITAAGIKRSVALEVSSSTFVYRITNDTRNLAQEQETPTGLLPAKALSSVFETTPMNASLQLPQRIMCNATNRDLKIFVYDLPYELGQAIENFLYKLYVHDGKETNFKVELALIQLFRSYPCRTWNASEADLFVVPYPHAGHCLTLGWTLNCQGKLGFKPFLRSSPHYNKLTRKRHLFLTLQDHDHIQYYLRERLPLRLVMGPKLRQQKSGVILVPTFNDDPSFQPSQIAARHHSWWTRRRRYAFTYIHSNPKQNGITESNRRFRHYFHSELLTQNSSTLGNLPYKHYTLSKAGDWAKIRTTVLDDYRNSIFCPVLAGDYSWQGRFFDVVLSGCIPIVLQWKFPNGQDKSWFLPPQDSMSVTIQQAYPLAKGMFGHDVSIELDYESFVVACPANEKNESDVSILLRTMKEWIENRPEDIRVIQERLRQAALALSWGIGPDAHQYDDSFRRVIRILRRYVDLH